MTLAAIVRCSDFDATADADISMPEAGHQPCRTLPSGYADDNSTNKPMLGRAFVARDE